MSVDSTYLPSPLLPGLLHEDVGDGELLLLFPAAFIFAVGAGVYLAGRWLLRHLPRPITIH